MFFFTLMPRRVFAVDFEDKPWSSGVSPLLVDCVSTRESCSAQCHQLEEDSLQHHRNTDLPRSDDCQRSTDHRCWMIWLRFPDFENVWASLRRRISENSPSSSLRPSRHAVEPTTPPVRWSYQRQHRLSLVPSNLDQPIEIVWQEIEQYSTIEVIELRRFQATAFDREASELSGLAIPIARSECLRTSDRLSRRSAARLQLGHDHWNNAACTWTSRRLFLTLWQRGESIYKLIVVFLFFLLCHPLRADLKVNDMKKFLSISIWKLCHSTRGDIW